MMNNNWDLSAVFTSSCSENSVVRETVVDTLIAKSSSTSPLHMMEDLVLEFEESAREIPFFFPIGESEGRCLDASHHILSVCSSQIPTENMLADHSNTLQNLSKNKQCVVGVLPNKMCAVAATNTLEPYEDPLSLAAPVKYVAASEECQTHVVGSTQNNSLLSGEEAGKPFESFSVLSKMLATIAHCPTSDTSEILHKASSTISKLRRQACNLMSTYTQLKLENDELIQKRNELQLETTPSQPTITIELLIPPKDSPKSIDSRFLYHSFPLDDDSLPPITDEEEYSELEVFMDEPYEDYYGVPDKLNTQLLPNSSCPTTNDCPKDFPSCRFGCICQSLALGKTFLRRSCRNPGCMLELKCMRPEDPSHSLHSHVSIMNGVEERNQIKEISSERRDPPPCQEPIPEQRRLMQKKNSGTCAPLENRVVDGGLMLGTSDPKLRQQCFVRLVKLNTDAIPKESLITYHNETRQVAIKRVKTVACYRGLPPRRRWRSTRTVIKENKAKVKNSTINQDWKLTAKSSVCLIRCRSKPGTTYFCMDHQKRGCSCLNL